MVFGQKEFIHGYPEELERLVQKNNRIRERSELFIHENSCEQEDEYEFVFLRPKTGPVQVSCRHCGFHLVVGLDSLVSWREQLCLEQTATSIGVKIGKAKRRAFLVESTKSGRERERTTNIIRGLPEKLIG